MQMLVKANTKLSIVKAHYLYIQSLFHQFTSISSIIDATKADPMVTSLHLKERFPIYIIIFLLSRSHSTPSLNLDA